MARLKGQPPRYRGGLTQKEFLEALEGEDIESSFFQGVVSVRGGQFIKDGEIIVERPTYQQFSILFNEYFYQIFSVHDVRDLFRE
jgi:hypothetical protein